jgi:hypothetical protein
MADADDFDPVRVLRTIEAHRVSYVLVGTLAGILRGAPETTRSVEICPQLKPENLQRLEQTLTALDAIAGAASVAGLADLASGAQRFATSCGELVVEAAPAGTRGYDDLRRRATRERIAADGLFVSIASLDDLMRSLGARGLPDDAPRIDVYRRLDELAHALERSHGLEL